MVLACGLLAVLVWAVCCFTLRCGGVPYWDAISYRVCTMGYYGLYGCMVCVRWIACCVLGAMGYGNCAIARFQPSLAVVPVVCRRRLVCACGGRHAAWLRSSHHHGQRACSGACVQHCVWNYAAVHGCSSVCCDALVRGACSVVYAVLWRCPPANSSPLFECCSFS